ncbi:MAG: HAD-IA family hydrolase [Isosphaeraceae bacterium]
MTDRKGRLLGVIFDMDGVLCASEPFTAEAASRMFAEKGYTVGREEYRPFVGQGEDRFIGGVAEARGIPLDPAKDKARVYELYGELIRGNLRPLRGAVDFVKHCRQRGLALAIASSADAIKVEMNLTQIGLEPSLFRAIVHGHMVVRKKPAPDIFLEAARLLDLPNGDCLVIEDAVAGVAAAVAAGSRCLALTTTFPADRLDAADWIAKDLSEVPLEALDW